MIRALKRKLSALHSNYDPIIVGNVATRHNAHVHLFQAEIAKRKLENCYLCHPDNRVTKIMDDAAVELRRQFILSVK